MNENIYNIIKTIAEKTPSRIVSFLFIGPPGCGKTWLSVELGKEIGCEIFKIDGSPTITKEDMEGNFVTKGKEIILNYGKIPKAIISANANGTAMILVNEFNLCMPAVQASFNAVLDFQGEINLGINNETITVNENSKLIFIATMNEDLAGLNPLQGSMKSRINYVFRFDYPTKDEELNLYSPYFSDINAAELFTAFIRSVREMHTKDNKLEDPISVREALNFLESRKLIDPEVALHITITSKLTSEPDEMKAIENLAKAKLVFAKESVIAKASSKKPVKNVPSFLRKHVRTISDSDISMDLVVDKHFIVSMDFDNVKFKDDTEVKLGKKIEGFELKRRNKKLYLYKMLPETSKAIKIWMKE